MKLKTTRKTIENNASRIASIPYCEAQHLLKYRSPFAYTCGSYGWNADFYDVDGVVIATGYRSLPKNNGVNCDYKTVRTWDDKAMNARNAEDIEAILADFIKAIKN